MREKIYRIAGMVLILMACSCNRYDIDEILLQRSDISLTVKGEVQFAFDPATDQIGQAVNANEFRVYDDKLADWFILTCDSTPTDVGQSIKGNLEWTTHTSTKNLRGLAFTVKQTNKDGLLWLWEEEQKIGLVIKNINNQ